MQTNNKTRPPEARYCIAVGDYSYAFMTDSQNDPMSWVERFTLADACSEINLSYAEYDCEYDLHIILEDEIDHDLCRQIHGDYYLESDPDHQTETKTK